MIVMVLIEDANALKILCLLCRPKFKLPGAKCKPKRNHHMCLRTRYFSLSSEGDSNSVCM
jgi:hypothetical protein